MSKRWGRPWADGLRQALLLCMLLCAGPALEACLLPEGSAHPPSSGGCSNPRCGCKHEPGTTCSCPCCRAGSDGSGDEAPVACSCYAGRGADEQPPVLIPPSIDPQQTAGTGDAWLPTPGSRCWGMEMEPPAAKDRPRRPPDPPPRPAY
jgi:hypothetical protein